MNRSEFITKLEQHGISLDESRMAEVNYYYNLWQDTMKQDLKMRHPHDFDAFISWMKKQ
tara:strand:- start:544 stop:720 length:177 start_codon:yes stop_codon:yes gene_type:complete